MKYILIHESLFNFGSKERITNDKVSILRLFIDKLSRFLHFAIEGHSQSHSKSFKVAELAFINVYPKSGYLSSPLTYNSSRLGNDTVVAMSN